MKTTNPNLFIHIGLIVRFLRSLSGGTTLSVAVLQAQTLIDTFEKAEFKVSAAGSHKLRELVKELEIEPDKTRKLTPTETMQFREIMSVLEPMVRAEAETKRLYSLSENRFNLDALLNKPQAMFSSETFGRLPKIARQDITSAFQCLAFDQPTAVGFHILRATEAILRAYYFATVKQKRLEVPMWGNMLDALTKRRKSDDKLLSRLRFSKDSYRNPTSHPEATYTFHEAQDLIGICIDVINRMALSLPSVKIADAK
jgi:hypothetical protein